MRLFKMEALLTVAVLCAAGTAQANWIKFDFPGPCSTRAFGIDGYNIVGSYTDSSSNWHGFLYDGTGFTTLDYPGAPSTDAYGIDGRNIVGCASWNIHGFLYDGETWRTLDFPGATNTYPWGIDGDRIVGYYMDASGTHSFIYTIPEPATLLLLGLGGLGLIRMWRGR